MCEGSYGIRDSGEYKPPDVGDGAYLCVRLLYTLYPYGAPFTFIGGLAVREIHTCACAETATLVP